MVIIPQQIQEWVNEVNNKRSEESTRLLYLKRLEDVNAYINTAVRGYKNKRKNKNWNKVGGRVKSWK